jgi:hypothetical protein
LTAELKAGRGMRHHIEFNQAMGRCASASWGIGSRIRAAGSDHLALLSASKGFEARQSLTKRKVPSFAPGQEQQNIFIGTYFERNGEESVFLTYMLLEDEQCSVNELKGLRLSDASALKCNELLMIFRRFQSSSLEMQKL